MSAAARNEFHKLPRKVGWWFIARRWWTCRKGGHKLRRFRSSSHIWEECYCGIRCVQRNPGALP